MLINEIFYEPAYQIKINTPNDSFFYLFDYDERASEINMEFEHFHPFYELCIFLDDHAEHLVEGKHYNIECCDIVAIRPNLLHKTRYPQGHPNKRIIIDFSFSTNINGLSDTYQNILSIFQTEHPVFRFKPKHKKELFEKLNEILCLSKQKNVINHLLIHHKFIEFLSFIYLHTKHNVYNCHNELDNISTKIYSITCFIHKHYQESLSLEELSKRFYMSNYYLSHQFKYVTGFTLTDYIQMTRIRNIQCQLLSSNLKITDIAFQCGFTSFSQFNRTFHKFTGISPSQFRSQKQIISHT